VGGTRQTRVGVHLPAATGQQQNILVLTKHTSTTKTY
jgi:hypothetical protein